MKLCRFRLPGLSLMERMLSRPEASIVVINSDQLFRKAGLVESRIDDDIRSSIDSHADHHLVIYHSHFQENEFPNKTCVKRIQRKAWNPKRPYRSKKNQ